MSTASPSAPARRKAHRRWVIVGVLLSLLASAPLGYYFITAWLHDRELAEIYAAMDAEDPNWRWPDLIASFPPPPPDDRNAALQVLKMYDLLTKTPFIAPTKKKGPDHRNARLPDEQVQGLRAAFSTLGPNVLDEARKLKDLPEGRFPWVAVENPLDRKAAPYVNPRLLGVMRLLQHDAVLRAHEGEIEGAAESCQAVLHAAHAINDSPGLMAHLIRSAGQAIAVEALEGTLGKGIVSAPRLQALQAALMTEADSNGYYHGMRGERAMGHQVYVLVSEGKLSYSEMFASTGQSAWQGITLDLFPNWFLGRRADILRLQNEQVRASKLTDEAQAAAFRALESSEAKYRWTIVPHNVTDSQGHESHLRCAITAVAAERYRLQHNRWPAGTDDLLKPGLLAKAYKDPFDGQPLRWKTTPTGLIIYSIGADKIDNGGNLGRGPRIAGGTDIGFELWLPNFRGLAPPPHEVQGK